MEKILLIEDDRALSNGICLALRKQDIHLEQCYDLKSASLRCKEETYDLLILDINLPDGNGLEFLKEHQNLYDAPVILLTANDLEMDIVTGLEMGAADYITKPFSLAVLRARVHTQLRQADRSSGNVVIIDQFRFDFKHMKYSKGEREIEFSKTEQKLLAILVENKGNTLSRGQLVDYIWTDGAEYVDENALSVTIKRLRDKLEDVSSKPKYIKTVYGIGYKWEVKSSE